LYCVRVVHHGGTLGSLPPAVPVSDDQVTFSLCNHISFTDVPSRLVYNGNTRLPFMRCPVLISPGISSVMRFIVVFQSP